MKLLYVTGNKAKIDSAKMYLEPLGIEVLNKKMLIPEIQANTCEEVAAFSAKYASNEMECSVLKNDSGLFIDSLNGFPGVYTHYVDDTLGEDGVLKLLEGIEDRTARFIEVHGFCGIPGKDIDHEGQDTSAGASEPSAHGHDRGYSLQHHQSG